MKLWYFLQWQWRQFETWQKWWMVGMFSFGFGLAAKSGSTQEMVAYAIAAVIMGGGFLKAMVWDNIRNQWQLFNKEQEQVVDILKDGVK
jgi:hypothetical protein